MLVHDWLQTSEGAEILRSISSADGSRLRSYGLLERPVLPASASMEDAHYKLVVVGKSGVGKTSTIVHLSGHGLTSVHCETAGIQTTKMYWPVKIAHLNKKVLMNLTFWDAGEITLKKFDHILPACKSGVDAVIFVFSFVDKGSWEEIPHLMTQLTDPDDQLAKIVIGTKFDQFSHSEVSQRELRDFELRWNIPIVKICNTPTATSGTGLSDIITVMNNICELLWERDVQKAEAV
ncbi:ciliogenesis and planar polarity effector 2 isoform X1 [Aplysia californica]|uniref:Ciliogenesis and planar polarity effector 2 n=1 Tax=Aplysia californica TaxID=6500 RepID=A0ABM0JVB1_APLCA|nr:ciliogenesis and planar polarity effector 2 isoform X1 [Aplysia californica]